MTTPPIIDIEASGLHFDSYPIEIAVGIGVELHSWLIRPEPQWQYWSETAEAMHGISRAQLAREGLPVGVVATSLNELSVQTGGVFYSDAAFWDEDWLTTLFHAAQVPMVCRVVSIFDCLSENENRAFLHMKETLAASGQFRVHRAGEDVRLLQRAYEAAKKRD